MVYGGFYLGIIIEVIHRIGSAFDTPMQSATSEHKSKPLVFKKF